MAITDVSSPVSLPAPVTITVPVGKTLKITSSTLEYRGTSTNPITMNGHLNLLLNNTSLANVISYSTRDNVYDRISEPVWLPSGTYTLSIVGYFSMNSSFYPGYLSETISGIEFNILP